MSTAALRLPLIGPERSAGSGPERSLGAELRAYLDEQQTLSAVESFALRHDAGEIPAEQRRHRELLPATPPGPGEQYAFEVDLERCTGCKACVVACNSLNGLDSGESWRSAGLLHGEGPGGSAQQVVTTGCHHCLEPACQKGCPVDAYVKDPVTGIVRHLDDQCIGCQYCTLTCPYEVPRYSRRLGIVRKCDMCSGRLAAGEAPACVGACPGEAITIRVVSSTDTMARAAAGALLPDAPSSSLTKPSTRYLGLERLPPTARRAEYQDLAPAPQHLPLVGMLVLTQLSVGAFGLGWAGRATGAWAASELDHTFQAAVAVAMGLAALGVSVLHLGRPLYAYRAVLGIARSWLSREILAFGGFATLSVTYAAALVLGVAAPTALPAAALGAGLVGVWCSVMLYHATGRTLWHRRRTVLRFGATSVVLGGATLVATRAMGAALGAWSIDPPSLRWIVLGVIAAGMAELAGEALLLVRSADTLEPDLARTARLMTGRLSAWTRARFGLGVFGGLLFPALLWLELGDRYAGAKVWAFLAVVSWATALAGALVERQLFFTAVSPARMPGGRGT